MRRNEMVSERRRERERGKSDKTYKDQPNLPCRKGSFNSPYNMFVVLFSPSVSDPEREEDSRPKPMYLLTLGKEKEEEKSK